MTAGTKQTRIITIATILILSVLFLLARNVKAETIPTWAKKQLALRDVIKKQIAITQKWQYSDGSIWQKLKASKIDDEPEIFWDWPAVYLLTGDESVYQSCKKVELKYLARNAKTFYHGFSKSIPNPDVEHVGEGVSLLADLAYLRPDDQDIIIPLIDIVEHCVTWIDGIPVWYNPLTRHMRNVCLSTTMNVSSCPRGVDWSFNLMFAKLALAAYYATKNEVYLNWVKDYLDGWIATFERNEIENGYYLIPNEVSPITGQIAPCSRKWYKLKFAPQWSWSVNGFATFRDLNVFIDLYQLTGDVKYLDAVKKQAMVLFKNGSKGISANIFNGSKWIPGNNDRFVNMAVEAGIIDPSDDPAYDKYLSKWAYKNQMLDSWKYLQTGSESMLLAGMSIGAGSAVESLAKLKALRKLPVYPDGWERIHGVTSLTMQTMGGYWNRGCLPWSAVIYYKPDMTLGLPEGIAALVVIYSKSAVTVRMWNNNAVNQIVVLQSGFQSKIQTSVLLPSKQAMTFDLLLDNEQ